MEHIRNTLTVILDTSQEEKIQIGKPQASEPKTPEEMAQMVIMDMATLAEALVVTIRAAHQMRIKDESDSMRDIIAHLESGFVDSTLKVELPEYAEWKNSYDDLLKYRRGRSKH
jgi:hypothetical protein